MIRMSVKRFLLFSMNNNPRIFDYKAIRMEKKMYRGMYYSLEIALHSVTAY